MGDYLSRLGPQGAERDWLIDQVAYLGYPPERVSAAIALLVSEGQAWCRRGVDGYDDVVLPPKSEPVWGRAA